MWRRFHLISFFFQAKKGPPDGIRATINRCAWLRPDGTPINLVLLEGGVWVKGVSRPWLGDQHSPLLLPEGDSRKKGEKTKIK
ncbi:hypothetical protein L209DRAFT_753332 [Thermothelomyces heterothallicus CBS 203.75]